jgi:hypothetical protein
MTTMTSSQHVVAAASSSSSGSGSSSTPINTPPPPAASPPPPLSPDNLTVQLLARLDTTSYNLALRDDAISLSHNFLLPYNFPWGCTRFHPYYLADKENNGIIATTTADGNNNNNGHNGIPPSSETHFVERGLPFDIDELDAICYYEG